MSNEMLLKPYEIAFNKAIQRQASETTPNKFKPTGFKVKITNSEGELVNIINLNNLDDIEGFLEEGDTWEDLTDYALLRREIRFSMFQKNIDKLTPLWWESLTEDEQNRIKAFRLAWLDYSATGIIPDQYQIGTQLNENNEEEAVMASTYVTDIFGVISLV